MSTTEDLSIKPYMFEPESERDENKDDEPAEQRLHMDVSQWCVTVFTVTSPSMPTTTILHVLQRLFNTHKTKYKLYYKQLKKSRLFLLLKQAH